MIICPDNIRNYISKFINSDWMYERNFIDEKKCLDMNTPKLTKSNKWGQEYSIKDLMQLREPARFLIETMKIHDAIEDIRRTAFDQYPVKNADG